MTVWKLRKRTPAFESKFLTVYLDDVTLPDGTEIDGYTVVQKPNIVMIVALTTDCKLIYLHEYKYAVGDSIYCLPAGHIKKSESPEDAAIRELKEEMGMTGHASIRTCGVLREYPTKDLHTVTVVFVDGITRDIRSAVHESTESIHVHEKPLPMVHADIRAGKWVASSSLMLSGVFA